MEQTVDTYLPSCRYCGQMLETGQTAFISQEDADEFATMRCECPEAKEYQRTQCVDEVLMEISERAMAKLDETLTGNMELPPVKITPELKDNIFRMIMSVYIGDMLKFTVKLNGESTLTVCMSYGRLRIKRTDKPCSDTLV